ncbi:MAG: 3-isopropylmalate dehydratase small subunit [Acidimicrobiales bacterium]
MRPVTVIDSTMAPLDRSDVDTDQVIPASWLKRVERSGFGAGLFAAWRQDPAFVLNDERYAQAQVLVAGPDFGIGSSREHAVWALLDYGFEAVISARFGDIFRTNCTKAGLVPVEVAPGVAESLIAAAIAEPATRIVVDVTRRVVEAPEVGIGEGFAMDDFTRWRFMEGLDDISLTLRHEADITAYEASRDPWLPTTA